MHRFVMTLLTTGKSIEHGTVLENLFRAGLFDAYVSHIGEGENKLNCLAFIQQSVMIFPGIASESLLLQCLHFLKSSYPKVQLAGAKILLYSISQENERLSSLLNENFCDKFIYYMIKYT